MRKRTCEGRGIVWRDAGRVGAFVLSLLITAASAGPAFATGNSYHAYTNITAFAGSCDGTYDTYSAQLGSLAESGLEFLGYAGTQRSGTSFSVTNVTTSATYQHDAAFYAHSHGDYYGASDTQGIRVDAGKCTGAPIVDSRDVDAVRYNPPTTRASVGQVIIFSTCYLGENPPSGTDQLSMSEAWGVAQNKTMSKYFGFFMSYTHEAFTSDEREFEGKFWARIKNGHTTFQPDYSLADAFTYARANSTFGTPAGKPTPAPNWYGNPYYTGWWDTRPGCSNCS